MIPDDLRRFVLTSIPSVPFLEAMLLFHTEPPDGLDRLEVARRLYVPPQKAQDLIDTLVEAGIVVSHERLEGWFCYRPRDEELRATIDALAQAYQRSLIEITDLIHDPTRKNAHRFANAFKLRKDR